jgi:hypothetical protein
VKGRTTLLLALCASSALAQEPSPRPRAVFRARAVDTLGSRAKTPAALDTATSDFDVGGVRVILRRITANDVVAANV